MICQTIGFPPIGSRGFGRTSLASRIRVPMPPQRIIAFIMSLLPRASPVGSEWRLVRTSSVHLGVAAAKHFLKDVRFSTARQRASVSPYHLYTSSASSQSERHKRAIEGTRLSAQPANASPSSTPNGSAPATMVVAILSSNRTTRKLVSTFLVSTTTSQSGSSFPEKAAVHVTISSGLGPEDCEETT